MSTYNAHSPHSASPATFVLAASAPHRAKHAPRAKPGLRASASDCHKPHSESENSAISLLLKCPWGKEWAE